MGNFLLRSILGTPTFGWGGEGRYFWGLYVCCLCGFCCCFTGTLSPLLALLSYIINTGHGSHRESERAEKGPAFPGLVTASYRKEQASLLPLRIAKSDRQLASVCVCFMCVFLMTKAVTFVKSIHCLISLSRSVRGQNFSTDQHKRGDHFYFYSLLTFHENTLLNLPPKHKRVQKIRLIT